MLAWSCLLTRRMIHGLHRRRFWEHLCRNEAKLALLLIRTAIVVVLSHWGCEGCSTSRPISQRCLSSTSLLSLVQTALYLPCYLRMSIFRSIQHSLWLCFFHQKSIFVYHLNCLTMFFFFTAICCHMFHLSVFFIHIVNGLLLLL